MHILLKWPELMAWDLGFKPVSRIHICSEPVEKTFHEDPWPEESPALPQVAFAFWRPAVRELTLQTSLPSSGDSKTQFPKTKRWSQSEQVLEKGTLTASTPWQPQCRFTKAWSPSPQTEEGKSGLEGINKGLEAGRYKKPALGDPSHDPLTCQERSQGSRWNRPSAVGFFLPQSPLTKGITTPSQPAACCVDVQREPTLRQSLAWCIDHASWNCVQHTQNEEHEPQNILTYCVPNNIQRQSSIITLNKCEKKDIKPPISPASQWITLAGGTAHYDATSR